MNFDFSKRGYSELLQYFQSLDFAFCRFDEVERVDSPKIVLLRHDVDFSLDYALDMAHLEADMGVSSTYFFLVSGDFYSLFNKKGAELIRRVVELGHEIGLHYEANLWGQDASQYGAMFRRDLDVLGQIAGQRIRSASQHNPIDTPYFKVEEHVEFEAYSGMIKKNFDYVSDSAMVWRRQTPWELARTCRQIHFLAHPIWWMSPERDVNEKLRGVPRAVSNSMNAKMEEFINYREYCLRERTRLDQEFHKKRSGEGHL